MKLYAFRANDKRAWVELRSRAPEIDEHSPSGWHRDDESTLGSVDAEVFEWLGNLPHVAAGECWELTDNGAERIKEL